MTSEEIEMKLKDNIFMINVMKNELKIMKSKLDNSKFNQLTTMADNIKMLHFDIETLK